MTPRVTTKSPGFGRGSLRFAAIVFAILAGGVAADPVSAAPTSVTTRPEFPAVCDTVGLIVAGTMPAPSPCYNVIGAEIEGPTELPTAGPIPTYAIRVRITVQEPNPLVDIACPAVLGHYERRFWLDTIPFGHYLVNVVEYLVPFSPDSTAAATDSSKLDSSFEVRPTCTPGLGCALLSFAPELPMRLDRCDATAAPGGTACFDVVLMNGSPVGGLQTEIAVFEPGSSTEVSADLLHPISVALARPGTGFQVAWTADGSRAKIVLFTAGSATIPPGEAHILRVCYAVAAGTPEDRYPMRYQNTVIADPAGGEIPPCLTLAEIVGSICVARTTGCDLNGDGASDILDIVQLVRCALSGPGGDACPDSVAAKADCNGDGVVNIRDVICCVRKILDGGFGSGGVEPPVTPGATQIGFAGPAQWISPTEGRATIEVTPGVDFAGMQFGIDGRSSRARIRELRLFDPTGAYQLESSVDADGGNARAMLYQVMYFRSGQGSSPGARASLAVFPPFRINVILEPAAGSTGTGLLELTGARSANFSAQAMATKSTAPTAEVPQSPGAAPSLSVPAPNPFAVGTEISYSLPSQGRVTLRVYSVSGRLVRTLVNTSMPAGVHRVPWDGRDSAGREAHSGIYFFKLTAGGVERTERVMRLR